MKVTKTTTIDGVIWDLQYDPTSIPNVRCAVNGGYGCRLSSELGNEEIKSLSFGGKKIEFISFLLPNMTPIEALLEIQRRIDSANRLIIEQCANDGTVNVLDSINEIREKMADSVETYFRKPNGELIKLS